MTVVCSPLHRSFECREPSARGEPRCYGTDSALAAPLVLSFGEVMRNVMSQLEKKGRLEGRSCGPRRSGVMAMTRHLPPSNPQPPLMSSLHHVGCGYKASCTGSSSSGTPAKWAWLRAVHKQQQQQHCYLLSVTTSCQNTRGSPTDTLVILPNSMSSFHFKCTDIFLNSMVVKVSLSVEFLYEKKKSKDE